MSALPELTQFRIEMTAARIARLIFDMPDRSMNVFSNAAIRDLGIFAAWARQSDIRGVVVLSGKASAFCAGADLGELGQAYGMIMAAPAEKRSQLAFDHFFPLSLAIRALETCGKPVAVAVSGLALGGGCELALGAHYRVAADTPNTAFGLPESLVGLLPGGGGTQRMPRVVGLDLALPVLLEARRLSPAAARSAGLVHEVTEPGKEVAAAERWVLSAGAFGQDWDAPDGRPADLARMQSVIAARRQAVLAETLGHYPAPLAILDCIERGLPQPIDAALRTEMEIFAGLIQRPEPRDMIAVMFVAKTDYERRQRKGELPAEVESLAAQLAETWLRPAGLGEAAALAAGGFALPGMSATPQAPGGGYWFEAQPDTAQKAALRAALERIAAAAEAEAGKAGRLQGLVDYAAVTRFGFPGYLGGPFTWWKSRQAKG